MRPSSFARSQNIFPTYCNFPGCIWLLVFTRTQFIVALEEREGGNTAQPELQNLCKQMHHLYVNQVGLEP